jgi:hypothetical protein
MKIVRVLYSMEKNTNLCKFKLAGQKTIKTKEIVVSYILFKHDYAFSF